MATHKTHKPKMHRHHRRRQNGNGDHERRKPTTDVQHMATVLRSSSFFSVSFTTLLLLAFLVVTGAATNNDERDTTSTITTPKTRKLDDNSDVGVYDYARISTIPPLADHKLPDKAKADKLAVTWGHWHFWDGENEIRPKNDYLSKYPNKDIPGDEFPDDAWQTDAVFVNHYLNDADKLVTRAMEAIYAEYGHGKPLSPAKLGERAKLFYWHKLDLEEPIDASSLRNTLFKYSKRGDKGDGGWTTERSFDGLVRRLLHAMMTSDTFTVVMGGHSSAAGHGNHFRQSYMMQFHKIMSPIFARLGVKLITRNVGMGGLGTIQNGLGSKSIYGNEIDLLIWDSGMTEGNLAHQDIFIRQAILGGNRVPVIWGPDISLLQVFHKHADADVGQMGKGTDAIITTNSVKQVKRKQVPYASLYMECDESMKEYCSSEKYCSTCWIDREDGITPKAKQLNYPKGRAGWHPGWRHHQLFGRTLAMSLLQALQAAITIWTTEAMNGPPLDDESWHVTEYYKNIKTKVRQMDESLGKCYEESENNNLPKRVCTVALQARTQYTPRANFDETGITSIIKPASDGSVPYNEKVALYDGPDAHNPCFDVPDDAIDVYDIVAGRRRRRHLADTTNTTRSVSSSVLVEEGEVTVKVEGGQHRILKSPLSQYSQKSRSANIITGLGWQVVDEPQGYCDGTYNAVCGRDTDSSCVLYGHHDSRGAVNGNEYSGWLVMNLPKLKEGIIIIKLHTWYTEDENTKTNGWTSVNNQGEQAGKQGKKRRVTERTKMDHTVQQGEYAVHDGANLRRGHGHNFQERKQLHEYAKNATTANIRTANVASTTWMGDETDVDVDVDLFWDQNYVDPSAFDTMMMMMMEGEYDDDDDAWGRNITNTSSTTTRGRKLKTREYTTPELPETFRFEYAIDGEITTLDREQFLEQKKLIQRVVEVWTLLDDPNYNTGKPRDVELAFRMRGCGRTCTFGISHVYWA